MQNKTDTKRVKKYWSIGSKEGKKLEFFPIFEINQDTGDSEARYIELRFEDEKGDKKTFTFNWLDIYMFIYFTANEELRRNLAMRYERKVNYIPYDVTVQCTPEEKTTGIAKRRIELPVDELTMAIARNEAYKMLLTSRGKSPKDFTYQKPRRH